MNFYRTWAKVHCNANVPKHFSDYRFNRGKDLIPTIEKTTNLKFLAHSKLTRKVNIEDIKYDKDQKNHSE